MNAITITVLIGTGLEGSVQWRGDGSWEGWLAFQKYSKDTAWKRRPDLDCIGTAGVSTRMERCRDHPEDALH